jgi:glutamate dehydrogenase/leucine dehydrogenase
LRGVVVVDNVTLGPAIGGVRVSPSVTPLEVFRLARAMTMKNSIAGIDHGGGKAGIIADPHTADLEPLFRAFARMIAGLDEYIPGPDMGCDEQAMVWIQEEIGRSVGLPAELGGLPLDLLGATGFGVVACAEVAAREIGLPLKGARVAIQGLGNVGAAAACFFAEKGASIVAVNDRSGTIFDPDGLDVGRLVTAKRQQGSVLDYAGGQRLPVDEIFALDCDILVPAANPDVIDLQNVAQVKAKLILQGANIPVTLAAEAALAKRGVLVVPDFIANAGGVIMAAMEYRRKSAEVAFTYITQMIQANTERILDKVKKEDLLPRAAGELLARERIETGMKYRSWSHKWR